MHASSQEAKQLQRRKGGGKGKGSTTKGSSSAAKSHGASSSFLSSPGASSFSLSSSSKSSASPYSDGGGKPFTLGSDSKFSGRKAGGGSRINVFGTSSFGSGYPYGGTFIYVDVRPLPFEFFPVPCARGYYGADVYLDDQRRIGGALTTAVIRAPSNTTAEVYRIVGDKSSVVSVFNALVANCSISNSSQYESYKPSSMWPLPEQVVQYYRASSFVLALDSYNNTAALASNAPSSNSSSSNGIATTPLPSAINGTFLLCLNSTIGESVPLVDVLNHKKLSTGAIVGIVIGGFIVLFVGSIVLWLYCVRKTIKSCKKWMKERKEKKAGKAKESTAEEKRKSIDTIEDGVVSVAPVYSIQSMSPTNSAYYDHDSKRDLSPFIKEDHHFHDNTPGQTRPPTPYRF